MNVQSHPLKFQNRSDFARVYYVARCALLLAIIGGSVFLPDGALCQTCNDRTGLRPLGPDESRSILKQLGDMRKHVRTLQADFVEKRTIPSLPNPLTYEGRVYYQNDGFFFMEYTKPVHHILQVMEDKALFFVKGSGYADLMDISSAKGVAGNPNVFALNPAKFSGQILEDDGVYILKDKKEGQGRNQPNPKLTVALERKSLQVKHVCIEDESGDVTTISLFNIQSNLDIPHTIRSFELPEGVKINQLYHP